MERLLNDLQNVDIDLWREIQGFRIHYELGGQELSLCDDRLLDHVQGACQRAIEARGWEFRLGTALMDESNKGCYCAIMYRVSAVWMDLVVSHEASTTAKAVLSAYIAARKACL